MNFEISILSKILEKFGTNAFYMICIVALIGLSLNHIKESNEFDRQERKEEREENKKLTSKLLDVLESTNKAIERNNIVLEKSDNRYISEELRLQSDNTKELLNLSNQTLKIANENIQKLSDIKYNLEATNQEIKRSVSILNQLQIANQK